MLKQFEREKNDLLKKNEELTKQLKDKTFIDKDKEELIKEIANLKSQSLQYQTDKANLEIDVNKIKEKYNSVLEFLKIDEKKIFQLIEKSKSLNIQKLNKIIDPEKLDYIEIELVIYNHIYESLGVDFPKYIDDLLKFRDIRSYPTMEYYADGYNIISKLYNVIVQALLKHQQKGIFFKIHDIPLMYEIDPQRWRILNALYFSELSESAKKSIVKIAKKLHSNPKNSEFITFLQKKHKIFYLYNRIFDLIKNEAQNTQYKFSLYFIIAAGRMIFLRHTLNTYPASKSLVVNWIKAYYERFYELEEGQLLKITPYIRVFVSDVVNNLQKDKGIKNSFNNKTLQYFYSLTKELFHITREQIVLEEKIKQHLNNEQLYKVNNRMLETLPLELSIKPD